MRSSAARIGDRAELRRLVALEAAAELAERRPDRGDDHRAGHAVSVAMALGLPSCPCPPPRPRPVDALDDRRMVSRRMYDQVGGSGSARAVGS